MEDAEIIELYFQRNESAIDCTDRKYGALCRSVAGSILPVREDAEECVSDTYLHAWNAMPPQRPASLRAWLGRITRNLSIDRYRLNTARKRVGGVPVLLSELEECVPDRNGMERIREGLELTELIQHWLLRQPADDRAVFLRRYFAGETVKELAKRWGVKPPQMAKRLYRLRQSLKETLEEEGVAL